MLGNQNPIFDYHKESSRDILCIDCKSFYASVECVERGLDPLKSKLALDNVAKHSPNMKAEWRYENVRETVWKIPNITDFWGIGRRTAKRLQRLGIFSVYDLAHSDYYKLKEDMGILGTQLYAHSWGIDRTFIGQKYKPKSKSIGNSQVLNHDYYKREEIESTII